MQAGRVSKEAQTGLNCAFIDVSPRLSVRQVFLENQEEVEREWREFWGSLPGDKVKCLSLHGNVRCHPTFGCWTGSERGHEEGDCDGMSQFPRGWESLVSSPNIFKVQARVEMEVLLTYLLSHPSFSYYRGLVPFPQMSKLCPCPLPTVSPWPPLGSRCVPIHGTMHPWEDEHGEETCEGQGIPVSQRPRVLSGREVTDSWEHVSYLCGPLIP